MTKQLQLGTYYTYWMKKSPRRFLYHLSYYHFASQMIGEKKRILDIGSNEGMGSYLLGKKCGFCRGIDLDDKAIKIAQENWSSDHTEFFCEDALKIPSSSWDAVTNFDVIEHILPEHMDTWWKGISSYLKHNGIAIVGTPSLCSKKYASAITNAGHVNLYSAERLKKEMKEHFEHVFLFSANDEVIHTGFKALAHYYIAIGCQKISNIHGPKGTV